VIAKCGSKIKRRIRSRKRIRSKRKRREKGGGADCGVVHPTTSG